MKADLKARWIEALRSGKYQQGEGNLKKDGRLCCLGVLREVADPSDTESHRGHGSVLSDAQCQRLGLPYHQMVPLWHRNDGDGMDKQPFSQIADWIEANVQVTP